MRGMATVMAGMAIAAGLSITGCDRANGPAGKRQGDNPGIIVALGDSLTFGYGLDQGEAYPTRLEGKLKAAGYQWQVINAGISGETSSGTLDRITGIIDLKPDIVILEIGANDGFQRVPPKDMQQNIDRIVTILRESRVTVILAGMKLIPSAGLGLREEFSSVYPTVAKKHGAILFPFFLEGVAGVSSLNLEDGIHPTGEGYRIITENIYPFVVKAIKLKER